MFAGTICSQTAPNFTITDTKGIEHNLYEDYLDQGIVVALKVMFVACPPCNAIAPGVQDLYEQWGEGMYDVQFIELSNKSYDSNLDVEGYQNTHGITFPGAGEDGGALTALSPYLQGNFGSFFGTPKFFVIRTDKTVIDVGGSGTIGKINALDDAIRSTGATGEGEEEEEEILPSAFSINVSDLFSNSISNFEVILTDGNGNEEYDITLDAGNIFSVTDLNAEYPGLDYPVVRLRKTDGASDRLSAIDLLVIIRHILGLETITDPLLQTAADANSDTSISAVDLFTLQRIILGLDQDLPNSDPYIFVPAEIPLILDPGNTRNINFNAIKLGDMNGF